MYIKLIIIFIFIIVLAALLMSDIEYQPLIFGGGLIGGALLSGETVTPVEYRKWTIVHEFEKLFTNLQNATNARSKNEALNILERCMLSAVNSNPPGSPTETDVLRFFSREQRELPEHQVYMNKMIEELQEKKLATLAQSEAIVAKMYGLVDRHFDTEADALLAPGGANAKINITPSGIIKYGTFTRKLSPERINILRHFANDDHLVATAIRYRCLISRGAQWNVPGAIYEKMVKWYGIDLECFASPINSQLLRLHAAGGYKSTYNFCSLYPDLDQVYGSIGQFFAQSLQGRIATVNPPYVLEIMDRVAEKCVSECKAAQQAGAQILLFVIVPTWDKPVPDYFETMSKSEFLLHKSTHKAFTHHYEDSNNDDKPIISTFGSTWFVLGVGEYNLNFKMLDTIFKPYTKMYDSFRKILKS